jgi:hypothetical protein
MRFSIANLLTAVAIIGVGLAALNSPSGVAAGLLTFATILVLLVAATAAIYRQGQARAFWLGVVLFGGSYFVVAFSTAFSVAENQIREPLKLFRRTFWGTPLRRGNVPDGKDAEYVASKSIHIITPAWDRGFGSTLHCVVNWLLALAGGIVGRWFYESSRRPNSAPQSQ